MYRPPKSARIDEGRFVVNQRALELFQRQSLADEFAIVGGGIQWALDHRIPHSGPLDMEAMAIVLDVRLEFGENIPFSQGLFKYDTLDADQSLLIRIDDRPEVERVTFGHEIGHYFLHMVTDLGHPAGYSSFVESFCDDIGTELALPKRDLNELGFVDESVIEDLVDTYHVEIGYVLAQLQNVGKLPRRVAVDSGFGPQPNPEFSNQINRGFACADCSPKSTSAGKVRCNSDESDIPILNFRHKNWSGLLSTCCGIKSYMWRPYDFAALQTISE